VLALDIYIAFLIKSALRLSRAWGSQEWPRVQARIDSSWLDGGLVWNCRTAEVAYTYEIGGQTYSAIDTKPFLIEASAERRIKRFTPSETVVVRVNPLTPGQSVLEQDDQSN